MHASESGSATTEPSGSVPRSKPSRVWVFTHNNYPVEVFTHYESLVTSGLARGIVAGRERGESGTDHVQGFVRWAQPRTFLWVRRTLCCPGHDGVPHVEPSVAPKAAIEYCKKEGRFDVYGEPGGSQGERTDLQTACRELLETRDLNAFKEEYPHLWVKYPRGFGSLIAHGPRPRDVKPTVVWIHGPTGTGKTRYVWDKEGEALWSANNGLTWFDGYQGQEAVLFDDFRGDWCKFHYLLQLLDRYPMKVPVKGDYVWWSPLRIYITSSKAPSDVYNIDEDMGQLLRRIDNIYYTINGIHT